MANTNDLMRQHNEIKELIDFLKKNLEADKVNTEAVQLAQNINILAGKLRIHLISEDDCLYPRLLKADDEKIRKTAERFNAEMGNLSQIFMDYKSKYNIASRILKDVEGFIRETAAVIEALHNRIRREDTELYILL